MTDIHITLPVPYKLQHHHITKKCFSWTDIRIQRTVQLPHFQVQTPASSIYYHYCIFKKHHPIKVSLLFIT